METAKHSAYNSTRGTVVNARLAIADRDHEPLKFLELLIGGLGLDSDSGVWLKPLAGAPHIPRVFPFDLVYLDQNQKVIQAAEVFPTSDFPPFSEDVVSALVLPLHAAFSTRTQVGDQLLIREAEEGSEAADVVPEQPAIASHIDAHEAAHQTIEAASRVAEEPAQLVPESPALANSDASAHGRQLTEEPVTPPVPAVFATRNWELPLEGFWAPQASSPKPPTETKKEPNEAKEAAKAPTPQHPPAATPVASIAAQTTASISSAIGAKTTASASNAVIPSVGPTVAQYKTWQVSTSTAPNRGFNGQKISGRRSERKDSPDPTRAAAMADGRKKFVERTPGRSELTRSDSDVPAPREGGPQHPVAESSQNPNGGLPAAAAEAFAPDTVTAPSPSPTSSIAGNAAESTSETSACSVTAASAPESSEPPLPLWKASPAPAVSSPGPSQASTASQNARKLFEPPRRIVVGSVPLPNSTSQIEKPRSSGRTDVKGPLTKSLVEQAAELSSHVPEALSRLMTAIHRIGGTHQETKQAARPKGSAPNKISSWLNPETLHRDRRRAVRRTVPGMVAFYFTGGAPQPYTVADISATGFYLVTRDQWMPETMIQMTLQKPVTEGKQRRESLTVLTRIVRRGEDGIGAEFVMPESLDPHNRDIKPGRATDRMALARFLFSEQFPDSFEVLGCFITPQIQQPEGASVTAFEYVDSNLD